MEWVDPGYPREGRSINNGIIVWHPVSGEAGLFAFLADLPAGIVIEIPGYISAEEYSRIRMAGYRNVRARIRVALDLDADLWLEFSVQAAREARDKRDVVEQALKEYLHSVVR